MEPRRMKFSSTVRHIYHLFIQTLNLSLLTCDVRPKILLRRSTLVVRVKRGEGGWMWDERKTRRRSRGLDQNELQPFGWERGWMTNVAKNHLVDEDPQDAARCLRLVVVIFRATSSSTSVETCHCSWNQWPLTIEANDETKKKKRRDVESLPCCGTGSRRHACGKQSPGGMKGKKGDDRHAAYPPRAFWEFVRTKPHFLGEKAKRTGKIN